jgi:hypothetical protein
LSIEEAMATRDEGLGGKDHREVGADEMTE